MATQPAHALQQRLPSLSALLKANSVFWPLAALALCAIVQIDLAFHRAINWDEFFHYSQVHLFANGTLTQPLQTLHARVFGWSIELPGNSIDHLRWIRFFSALATIGAAGCVYGIAGRFADQVTAATCALLYLSAGLVLQHGSSFRADPYLALLLMASLLILLRAPLTWLACAAAGLLFALGTLASIKTVLYAPAFAGVAAMRWIEAGWDRRTFLRLLSAGLFAAIFFALLYFWHSATLGQETSRVAENVVKSSSRKMFALGGLPYYHFILKAALYAVIFTGMAVVTPFLLFRTRIPAEQKLALGGLWLPITVVAFYHNTAPYFYVFILPPLAASCVLAVRVGLDRYGAPALSAMLALGALVLWTLEDRSVQAKQSALIDAANVIFPRPVAYFDNNAMLGHFPKANHFMTPWGQENYLARRNETFVEVMGRTQVPLVVEVEPMFEGLLRYGAPTSHFLPEDAAALRANYIHFWGPYWVAGKKVRQEAATEEFLVPGPYTVKGGAIQIDGRRLRTGEIVTLERGSYRVASEYSDAWLVWGEHLKAPAQPAPKPPYWVGF